MTLKMFPGARDCRNAGDNTTSVEIARNQISDSYSTIECEGNFE